MNETISRPFPYVRVFLFVSSCLLILPTHARAGQSELPKSILVPVGKIKVDVIQAYTPARQAQIAAKLEAASSQNPELIREIMKKGSPGKPPPYDPRIGISAAEYREFFALKPYMRKAREAILVVKSQGSQGILDGGRALPELTGIRIDVSEGTVTTPYGVLTECHPIKPKQQIVGPWEGMAWTYDSIGVLGRFPNQKDEGIFIEAGLGKLKQSGRGLFFFRVQKIENRNIRTRAFTTVEYDLKPAKN